MGIMLGIALAMGVGLFGTYIGFDRDRVFYPLILMVIATYYVLFALCGAAPLTLVFEIGGALGFAVLAVLGFRRNEWLVVCGLVLHGCFDIVHDQVISNAGVPTWWPEFCLAFDVAIGFYLASRLMRCSHRNETLL